MAAVGLLDVVTGLWLLFSPTPWTAHGPDTLWLQALVLVVHLVQGRKAT